jgi:hypothetical protein
VASPLPMPMPPTYSRIVLMTTEHAELGFATVANSKLYLWLREPSSNENAGWVESRIIELKMFSVDALLDSPYVAGFAQGVDIIFVGMGRQLFTIDLKSTRVTKVYKDISSRHI